MGENQWPIKSIKVASELVEALLRNDGATLSELADELDLPKSTMHGYLKSLQLSDLVVKENNTYRASTRFLEIGSYVRKNRPIYEAALPEIKELSQVTGQKVSIMIEENGWGVTLYTHGESPRVDIEVYPGFHTELHTTSGGKAILAMLPREEVSGIVNKRGLEQRTENTITEYNTLIAELETIQEQGYAVNSEERVQGMYSYGAAVTDEAGYPVGAIVVFGPASLIGQYDDDEKGADIVAQLKQTVNIVEINLSI